MLCEIFLKESMADAIKIVTYLRADRGETTRERKRTVMIIARKEKSMPLGVIMGAQGVTDYNIQH